MHDVMSCSVAPFDFVHCYPLAFVAPGLVEAVKVLTTSRQSMAEFSAKYLMHCVHVCVCRVTLWGRGARCVVGVRDR